MPFGRRVVTEHGLGACSQHGSPKLRLARQLTRIMCEMELGVETEELRRRLPDVAALDGFYDQLGFGPFLRRQGERLAQLPLA